MLTKSLLLALVAPLVHGHIIMTNPVPYGKSTLNNSPLAADGSDFPCKQRSGVYDDQGASNVYKQGSTQQLSFQGTAVHGGGSCQVAVTEDQQPTKSSVWRVIKSIEGGCPAKNQQGNLGDDATAAVPYKYDFDIPKDLAAGNYTLAWVWFNKVGNREMYMNCAPMSVEGSAGSDTFLDSLPNMFVANIGNGCTLPYSVDVLFPNPGSDVDKFNGATNAFYLPTDPACGKAAAGAGGAATAAPTSTGNAGAYSAPASQPTSTSPPSSASAPPSSASAPAGATTAPAPGGVFVTAPPDGSSSAPVATTPPSISAVSSAAVSPTTSASSGSGSGSGSSSGSTPGSNSSSGTFSAGTACSTEGEWNCIGGTSFQRCASGSWTAPQPMAAGVACTAGQSSDLQMASAKLKRAMRWAARMF